MMKKILLNIIRLTTCTVFLSTTSLTVNARHLSPTAYSLEKQGFINIHSLDKSIFVSLMYSRADNFTGHILYNDLREAYLYPSAAKALVKAQKRLKQIRPDLSLIIFDAARPMSIQQKMWNVVAGTRKNIYVSNPAHGGGLHNYGLAVDISICDLHGDTIPMGTKVDYLGKAAHIDNEGQMIKMHLMTRQAIRNRRLLREVMRYAGFKPLRTEWWHFNFKTRKEAKTHYKIIK